MAFKEKNPKNCLENCLELNPKIKVFLKRVGALVEWLREETRNQKVVSLYPGEHWMDVFHIHLLLNCNVGLKRLKIN